MQQKVKDGLKALQAKEAMIPKTKITGKLTNMTAQVSGQKKINQQANVASVFAKLNQQHVNKTKATTLAAIKVSKRIAAVKTVALAQARAVVPKPSVAQLPNAA